MVNFTHGQSHGHSVWGSATVDDAQLLGPEGEAVKGATLDELLRRQVHPSSERKREAGIAYDVYRNSYGSQVLAAINIQQHSATIREDLKRFLTLVRNDARDVTEDVAVVWDNNPERHIVGEDGEKDEDGSKAITKLAKESSFDEIARMVNHLAWLQGPQYVVPMVRGKGDRRRLRADVLSPHMYDIVQNEDDPLGDPVAIAWHIHTRTLGPAQIEVDVFVLDAVSLRRFKVQAAGSGGDISERKETTVLEHNYGRVPAAGLRFTRPIVGDDWYLCSANSRLITGTIEIAVVLARMALVRRAQCHHLLSVVGAIENAPKGQETGDPESKLVIPTARGVGTVGVEVHDYDTPPDSFIRMILFWSQCMIEPLGGHIQVDSGQPDIFGKVVIPHEVQVEHRDRQLPAASRFERDWWAAATAVALAERLPVAIDLPTNPEDVHERVRTDFGTLSRSLKDPEKAAAAADWALSRGQTSEVEIMRERLGGVSEAEAWSVIVRNMENRAKFNDLATKRNLPAGEGGTQTTAEANGAQGTPAREANREGGEQDEAGGPPSQPAAA